MKTTTLLLRASQVIKPHTPLIKFRKGQVDAGYSVNSNLVVSSKQVSGGSSSKIGGAASITIEDYQLPLRFRRIPLDQYEIDAVNSGGSP